MILSIALIAALACGCPQKRDSPPPPVDSMPVPPVDSKNSPIPEQDEPAATEPAPSDAAQPRTDAGATASEPPPPPYFNPLTPEQTADGWISLFDGHTLYGWESNNSEVNWSCGARLRPTPVRSGC
jgi:hypothetical protein